MPLKFMHLPSPPFVEQLLLHKLPVCFASHASLYFDVFDMIQLINANPPKQR
jgi:hypothetical protein